MFIVNSLGVVLILVIVWWFWIYKQKVIEVGESGIKILVENGTYVPSRIKVKAGIPITMQFIRKDASPCAETLLFPSLEISEILPLGQPRNVDLPAMQAGEYSFHCQMQMYKGTLIVEQSGSK